MPRPDYLPRRDLEFLAWTINFTARVVADPAACGISPADAAAAEPDVPERTRTSASDATRLAIAAMIAAVVLRSGG